MATSSKKSKHKLSGENPTAHYCSAPKVPRRSFGAEVNPFRASAILLSENKWVNGTVIHYYFFDQDTDGEYVLLAGGRREWRSWVGSQGQQDVVREAFRIWKDIGMGLEFKEVNDREDAEVRIGFMPGDGAP